MTKVAAIVGATATGKTEVALEVASRLGAEIVSIDSMQSYVGMDIGTAKPPASMRERVPHHLLDTWPPSHDLTVAEFQRAAKDAIAGISRRRRLPLLVGGSGLYLRAVLDDFELPPRSQEVRDRLYKEAEAAGPEPLYRRLQSKDPLAASRIDSGNVRRIVRALEVIEITDRPFSSNYVWERYESGYELAISGLTRPRPELFERIERRVDEMVASGLFDEVRSLALRGMSATARQALGYRHALDRSPAATDEDVVDAIVKDTKRFARRQESLLRADPRIRWFDATDEESAVDAVTGFFKTSLGLA